MKENTHDFEARSRLLARIVRTLLAEQAFESLPDFTEELKCRCARLRITWTPDDITQAYRVVESNTPLPGAPQQQRRLVEREPDSRSQSMNPAELARFHQELERRFGQLPVKGLGNARATDAAHEATVRAQAEDFKRRYPAKRLPFVQRLAEIFSGRF
jgi:hypothetical protein